MQHQESSVPRLFYFGRVCNAQLHVKQSSDEDRIHYSQYIDLLHHSCAIDKAQVLHHMSATWELLESTHLHNVGMPEWAPFDWKALPDRAITIAGLLPTHRLLTI